MAQSEQALLYAMRAELERLSTENALLHRRTSHYGFYWQVREDQHEICLKSRSVNDALYSDDRWLFSARLSFGSSRTIGYELVDDQGICHTSEPPIEFSLYCHLNRGAMPGVHVHWKPYAPDLLEIRMSANVRYGDPAVLTLPLEEGVQLISEFCAILRNHLSETKVDALEPLANFEQACRSLGAES